MATRIDTQQAQTDLTAGALLVCAYDDDKRFQQNYLAGAISLEDLQAQEQSLPKDKEVIFYCA